MVDMTDLKCRKALTLEGDKPERELESETGSQTHLVESPLGNNREVEGNVSSEPVDKETEAENGGAKEKESPDIDKNINTPKASVGKSKRFVILQRLVKVFFGCMAAGACGTLYIVYLSTYYEKKFWFTSRQDLEAEITFQGGSGLYYYYYKHMLASPTFERGFYELMVDNRTVSGQTINAVERLSLYPELITALIYRAAECQDLVEPIHFYVGAVFVLQAVHVTALFVCSWVMSGTWMSGMLAVAWCVINRTDTTRVDFGVPLRENWALPCFSCQVAALTGFLSNGVNSSTEMFCYLFMSSTTFTFLLVWEHSHYILFVQGLCLFLLDSLDLVPHRKMADIHKVYLSSLFLAYLFHFQNPVLLSCPLLSLLIASVLARFFQKTMKMGPVVARLMKLFVHFHLVFTTAFTFSYVVRKLVPVRDGDFLLKFLEVKFGLNTTTDFITNFLLCQEGAQGPGQQLFLRLTQASVLPFYVLVLSVCLLSTLQTVARRLRGQPIKTDLRLEDGRIGEHPEVIYHVFQTMLFGGLALVFEWMKYLWTPYVCVLAAFGVCSPDLWMTVFRWLRLKFIHPVVLAFILSTAVPTIIGFSLWTEYFPRVLGEFLELQESYDADTVELMNWIRSHVSAGATFAGSPQLMGTVKLCTGLAVTSLPLYTDVGLLRRTEDTLQVYAKRSAEDVYKILTAHSANYVILEDQICDEYSAKQGCTIKDLLDISNGHVVYDSGVIHSIAKHGRFCNNIKMNYSPYTNYFTRIFWNRSYHIYKVNSVISFQY